MSRRTVSPLLAIAAAFGISALTACNTVEGVGEDVQQAGETIEQSADDVGNTDDPTPKQY